jgi:hypothetical protein
MARPADDPAYPSTGFRPSSASAAASRRAALRLGLACGAGAFVLFALQALGRPHDGVARGPTAAMPLPSAAFESVRLPRAFPDGMGAAPTGPLETNVDASFGRDSGGPDPAGSADRRRGVADPAPAAEPGVPAAVVPDRVILGLQPPAVVRFRPPDGTRGVDPGARLSVRFTAPMDRAATEAAFTVLVDGEPVRGRRWWAEDDTVLVLEPAAGLPPGAEVRLAVSTAARSRIGLGLVTPATATIRVAAAATPRVEGPAGTVDSSAATGGWRWPLGGPVTQRFGESLTRYGWHAGIDIDGSTGDAVVAARAGRVVVAGRYDACGGLEVHIDHGDGLESWYRHLSLVEVGVGDRIAAGTRIGRVGNTGCSLGSHLHFAIRLNGAWVDPLRYLPPR